MKHAFWNQYPTAFKERISHPFSVGFFDDNALAEQDMRVAIGKEGNAMIYLIVDKVDGVIADAVFQAYGSSALIGVLDILCEMVLRKTHLQAGRISASLVEKYILDAERKVNLSLPSEVFSAVNTALSALLHACDRCKDIQIEEVVSSPPTPVEHKGDERVVDWSALSEVEKLSAIKKVIKNEIQPFIALDAGGVEVLELDGLVVKIAYQGACVTCPSATGATLSAIQEILRAQVHPGLEVKPDLSYLS